MDRVYREVTPAAVLTTQFGKYYLLDPFPTHDNWEKLHGSSRFVVVPHDSDLYDVKLREIYYPPARHLVVTPPWQIEYIPMTSKLKVVIGDDLSKDIEITEPAQDEPSDEDKEWLYSQLEMEELVNA